MGILTIVLLVLFVIIAILLILLVLVQNEEGDGLGGIFGGGAGSAFGSRSGNVLTRATSILGALFLIVSLSLALLSRTPAGSGVEEAGRQQATVEDSTWLDDEAANPDIEEIDFNWLEDYEDQDDHENSGIFNLQDAPDAE